MKFIDEYRDRDLIVNLSNQINRSVIHDYTFMEVCGGHTAAIHRFGIPSLISEKIRLISGPGCPVCVTGTDFIDKAVAYSQMEDVILTTFGDLIRVPGSNSSLEKMREKGADIRIVFSGLDALEIAKNNPDKKIIFLAIGFETTAPGTAVTVKQADKEDINNFFVLSAHKVMPPAMETIVSEGVKIDGFICPGHVSAITGSSIFNFIPEKYKISCVITGFEPADLLQSILMLVRQVNQNKSSVEIQYKRAVTVKGNTIAQENLKEIFEPCNARWRGFGVIQSSGLCLQKKYERFNADIQIPLSIRYNEDDSRCICGEILRGMKTPDECPLFANLCIPENPAGACMVSNEGSCNTWYKYKLVR
jgi:hydrogenase expression/formation protein HypD